MSAASTNGSAPRTRAVSYLGRGALGPADRAVALSRMAAEPFDVLVVGGGVVGAGAALDAVSRGLRVALVEARDWASGTSSRSSKLIHGGLRYLEMLDFALVREALIERGLLLQRLAPHLVRPMPFLYPLRGKWERPYVGAGLLLYDTLSAGAGWGRGLPRHRHLPTQEAQRIFPSLRADAMAGAMEYWDAQVDDARHTLTLVRTAASLGAVAASRTQVVRLRRQGARVTGAELVDLEGGRRITVAAHQVVVAAGVWTDRLQQMAGARQDLRVRAAKGVHLVVARDRIDGEAGLILRTDKSVLFVIPWDDHWIIGTTDTDWAEGLDHPTATAQDVDYLLDQANRALRVPLTRGDVLGVFAGLRPLISKKDPGDSPTTKVSREHMVSSPAPGMVMVAGGKYTTYRVMAKDAVDMACSGLGSSVPRSCTAQLPLLGSDGYQALCNSRERLAEEAGLPLDTVDHLLGRYGSMTVHVLRLIEQHPELRQPLAGGEGYLQAEVVYAVEAEGARHLEDVLVRRTRLSFEGFDRGLSSAGQVAALMAPLLGWDEATRRREVEHYVARVEAERRAEQAGDDATAAAARLAAPELIPLAGTEDPLVPDPVPS